ncbi:hypothetical protein JTE90_012094 [Oedothorax gibbosus]|uniref:TFIIS N-terminal domain-containing protein n=1 Tax=Oedothorax gibbosus TaxID=931172 RepID=A0AAV6UNL9_9ARAC|nr:hypothetical protein JTE90_012094 [Oedothorax gibbosus]
MAATLKASLVHWKKKLERITDEEAILATIHKLSKVPITLELLQDTGIGKTIRSLAKKPGKVGSKSSQVLLSWRDVVATAQETPDKHSKHSSHKKELSNGDKSHDKHSSSSHEKHKSKHSSDSNHKQKHLNSGQDPESFTSKSDSKEKHRKSNHSSDSNHKQKHVNHSSESKYKEHENHKKSSKHSSDHRQKSVNEDSNNSFGSDSIERKVRSFDSSSKKPAKDDTQLTFSMTNGGGENLQFETNGKIKSFSVQYNDKKRKHESSDGDTVEKKPKTEKPPKSETSDHKKSERKEEKVKVKHEHKSEKSQKDKNARMKVSSKPVKVEPNEGFTASEVRFEDCLGFNDVVPVKKKKVSKTLSEKKKPHVKKEDSKSSRKSHTTMNHKIKTENFETDLPNLLQQQPPTMMKEVDILSTLPQTQPNYRPLPQRSYDSPKQKKVLSNEEAIMFTSSRREKTSVYSGKKSAGYTEVPTLLNACIQVLIENIDAIEYMGGVVPYFVLKQVLVKCTPQQLYNIEDYNPYLLEDTQELWEVHYKKEFRNLQRQENETWRDAYLRAVEEREMKFRNITANISASMSTKYKPGRQVKLAYVDSFVKPPRDVARKQAKNGTALPVNHPVKAGPPSKATPRPTAPAINAAAVAVASTSRAREIVPKKPSSPPDGKDVKEHEAVFPALNTYLPFLVFNSGRSTENGH